MVTDLHHHHRHPQWQLLTRRRHREVARVPPFPGRRRTSAGQAPAHSLPLERSLHRLGEVGVAGHLEHHRRAPAQAPQGTVALWGVMEGGEEREREKERREREREKGEREREGKRERREKEKGERGVENTIQLKP